MVIVIVFSYFFVGNIYIFLEEFSFSTNSEIKAFINDVLPTDT